LKKDDILFFLKRDRRWYPLSLFPYHSSSIPLNTSIGYKGVRPLINPFLFPLPYPPCPIIDLAGDPGTPTRGRRKEGKAPSEGRKSRVGTQAKEGVAIDTRNGKV